MLTSALITGTHFPSTQINQPFNKEVAEFHCYYSYYYFALRNLFCSTKKKHNPATVTEQIDKLILNGLQIYAALSRNTK